MHRRSLLALLACPACSGPLEQLVCSSCGARYRSPGGIPDLRLPSDPRTEVVREFYSAAPFPGYPPRETLVNLRERGRRSEFARLLDEAIPPGARVLELGCGTGQLSLFLATGERMVIAADLARASLELGAEAAKAFRSGRGVVRGNGPPEARAPGGGIRCGGLLRGAPPHPGPTERLRRRGSPGEAGRIRGPGPLQLLRPPATSAAARHRPPERIPGDPTRPCAPGAALRARAEDRLVTRPVPAPRGAPAHAARSEALVPGERESSTCAPIRARWWGLEIPGSRASSRRPQTTGCSSRFSHSSPGWEPSPQKAASS